MAPLFFSGENIMAYDNPDTLRYDLASMDFGAAVGNTTRSIKGPAGKKGRITNIGVDLTEATVFATTLGKVQVGLTGTLAAYAELNIPTASAINTTVDSTVDTNAIIAEIPADTAILITLIEGTGAGLTGIGFPFLEVAWF